MIAENLIQYLRHPEGLQRVSYQELKTLALEYPYCPHVQQLLLLKSRLADHKDFQADLSRAAAHSIDRNFLRIRLKELDASLQQEPVHEEFFELKPLAELEQRFSGTQELDAIKLPQTQAPVRKAVSVPVVKQTSPESEEEAFPDPPEIVSTTPETPEVAHMDTVITSAEAASATPEPMDKDAFRTWKRRHTLHLHQTAPISVLSPKPPDEPVELSTVPQAEPEYNLPDLRFMAERSVEEKDEVASETLAALLARQGHLNKAVEMYERLCLTFPEKSAYFAAQIENLKK